MLLPRVKRVILMIQSCSTSSKRDWRNCTGHPDIHYHGHVPFSVLFIDIGWTSSRAQFRWEVYLLGSSGGHGVGSFQPPYSRGATRRADLARVLRLTSHQVTRLMSCCSPSRCDEGRRCVPRVPDGFVVLSAAILWCAHLAAAPPRAAVFREQRLSTVIISSGHEAVRLQSWRRPGLISESNRLATLLPRRRRGVTGARWLGTMGQLRGILTENSPVDQVMIEQNEYRRAAGGRRGRRTSSSRVCA